MPLIKAENIEYSHGPLSVIDDISFCVEEGDFISIIGPSGCGKTTLLKIIGGLIPGFNGNLAVKGGSLDLAVRRRDFGFVFQDPVLLPWRTVLQNLELPLEIIGGRAQSDEPQKLLGSLGLDGFGGYYPQQLSGGMQQRVAIARALVYNPGILLMDEPFGSLDEFTREKLQIELLKVWQATNKTVLFVTHSISEAVFVSNKIIVLSERPAKIIGIREIDMPYPRTLEIKQTPEFIKHVSWLRQILKRSLQ